MLAEQISAVAPDAMAASDLLDRAGDVTGERVLVLGGGALPVLCGLIRRGAAAAAEFPLNDRGNPDPVELVIVPDVATSGHAAAAIAIARRALLGCGRIVLRPGSGPLARETARLLRLAGFATIRASFGPDGAIVSAERPMFGPTSVRVRA